MKHLAIAALALFGATLPALAEVDVNARGLFDIRIDSNPATHLRVFETSSTTTSYRIEDGAGYAATFSNPAVDPVQFETFAPWGDPGAFVNRHVAGVIASVPDDETGRQLVSGIRKSTMDITNLGPNVENAVLTVSYDLAINLINDTKDDVAIGRSDILFELDGEQIGLVTFSARDPSDPSLLRDVFIYQFPIQPDEAAQITITIASAGYARQTP